MKAGDKQLCSPEEDAVMVEMNDARRVDAM